MTWNGPERREDMLTAIDRRLSMHEVVCAERYKAIEKAAEETSEGLKELRTLVLVVGGVIICGMAGLIIKLVLP